jgi:hypothetical protein
VLLLSRHQRAIVSALLLTVQVLGLGHLALGSHTRSETGAMVDVVPLAVEQHDEQTPHLCSGDVSFHADEQVDCLVVAGWSSPSLPKQGEALDAPQQALAASAIRSRVASTQLEVLSARRKPHRLRVDQPTPQSPLITLTLEQACFPILFELSQEGFFPSPRCWRAPPMRTT